MTKAISLIVVLLVASRVGLALDPVIDKAAAAELVRDALASLGEDGGGSKIAIGPWPYYWAPTLSLSKHRYSSHLWGQSQCGISL